MNGSFAARQIVKSVSLVQLFSSIHQFRFMKSSNGETLIRWKWKQVDRFPFIAYSNVRLGMHCFEEN